jgi:hypothetical protein
MKKLITAMMLVGCICWLSATFGSIASARNNQKFYITAPWINDQKSPVVSFGDSRMQALANSGITVWTEEEWTAQKWDKEFKLR